MITGYTRPLTANEDPAADIARLRTAGADQIAVEAGYRSRTGPATLLARTRQGDTILVTSLNRLGATITQVIDTLLELRARDIHFECLTDPVFNTTGGHRTVTDNGQVTAVLEALSGLHRTEISRRTRAGMIGRPRGRPAKITTEGIDLARQLRNNGHTYAHIAGILEVHISTVFSALRREHPRTPGPAHHPDGHSRSATPASTPIPHDPNRDTSPDHVAALFTQPEPQVSVWQVGRL